MARALGRWTLLLDAGTAPPRALIGGKARSLAEMSALGLPVPPAFVVTTEACRHYLAANTVPDGLEAELAAGIAALEEATGRTFGGAPRALLVAVRSGSVVSMPGMMDTVLNLGINDEMEAALAAESGSAAFARDTHRRFLDLYTRIVLKATTDALAPDAAPAEWRRAIERAAGMAPSLEPAAQLLGAVRAVFESWNSRRARRYREHHGLSHDLGTAVTVQAMIFGNLSDDSGSGVLFSRNPLNGAPEPYGEYLSRAQGEEVVSGSRTPEPLAVLADRLPAVHEALLQGARRLEQAHNDVQDIEFTVERGRLYFLQSRAAKRAPEAAVALAVDFVREGRLTEAGALQRVSAEQARSLLRPRLNPGAAERSTVLAKGEGACPGIGVGTVVTDSDQAEAEAAKGRAIILVRPNTSPEDVHGMIVAQAVVTAEGGATSHAAVVSRALGLPCAVGCGPGVLGLKVGQTVTVDGAAGCVFDGALPVSQPDERKDPKLAILIAWASAQAPLKVYRPGEEPPGAIVDLDRLPGGTDPARLAALLRDARAARGVVLGGDQGIAAAVRAGLAFIVTMPVLPALLAACAAARGEGPEQRS